jgi:hypothetical protein
VELKLGQSNQRRNPSPLRERGEQGLAWLAPCPRFNWHCKNGLRFVSSESINKWVYSMPKIFKDYSEVDIEITSN